MGRINGANLKKTVYYLKKNGLKRTWYAVRERLDEKRQPPYLWTPPSESELENQRMQWEKKGFSVKFSILVPAYRTKPEYLKELIESLRSQTYPGWELILADASEDDSVERVVRRLELPVSETKGTVSAGGAVCNCSLDEQVSESVPGCNHDSEGDGREYPDTRIRYIRLPQNAGIAGNTNQALSYVAGEYVGLLDHDDVLPENALYEMAAAIEEGRQRGCMPRMLYSDEDKCNGDKTEYYEPNYKEDFNLDLLLSNNYICHFLVMERELIQRLKFRQEFEGAQDYDLVLRAVAELGLAAKPEAGTETGTAMKHDAETGAAEWWGEAPAWPEGEKQIVHIPRVLYHWRCHTGSTAENPQSKLYAYEAGRRAIQDFADRAGWRARAEDTEHVGFYSLQYEGSLFDSRPDVGAVGGSVTGRHFSPGNRLAENVSGSRNGTVKILPETGDETVEAQPGPGGRPTEKVSGAGNEAAGMRPGKGSGQRCVRRVTGGRMAEDGIVFYENLPVNYSGYLHRAILPQDAFAVDIRNIRVRPECRELFRKVTGVPYQALPGTDIFDVSVLPEDCDIRKVSLEFGRAMREAGYRIIYTAHRIDL